MDVTLFWRLVRRSSLADYTVTEAGFGADLGAEKFLDIKTKLAKPLQMRS